MRFKAWLLLLLAPLLMAPSTLDSAGVISLTNCSSSGSSASALTTSGSYLLAVFDEEVFVCFAATSATCTSGGTRLPQGAVLKLAINTDMRSVACRSAASTGDLQFTPSN